MKRLFLSVVSCVCVLAMSVFGVSASLKLPDGGQIGNTGVPEAYGRSSGGKDGYANLECSITSTNAGLFSDDYATAVIESDVRSGLELTVTMAIFYTSTDGSEVTSHTFEKQTKISDNGYTTKWSAPNRYGVKGTAGYYVDYDTRGTFSCGITDKFSAE